MWYRKQHALQPGANRKFEHLKYTDSSADSRFRQTGEVDMWQTFEDFETGKLLRGWASPDILAAFKDIVEKHNSECLYVRGEWLIPKFMGVQRLQGSNVSQTSTSSRCANIERITQLRILQDSGQRLLEQAAQGFVAPRGLESSSGEGPTIVASVNDQPRSATLVDVVGSVVAR